MQFNRKCDVLAARLRCDNADLLDNLFNRNLSDTNMCPYCNTAVENIVHYYIQQCSRWTAFSYLFTHLNAKGPHFF